MLSVTKMKSLQKIALILAFIGALNWGLIGIFSFDLVAYLFGTLSMVTRAVYIIVLLSGLYSLSILGIEKEEYREEHQEISRSKKLRRV